MQLEKYLKVTGIMRWEGGRVGGQKESVEIAASTENPIVRHPISNVPYIPGSSVKGKIRSLLELSTEKERLKQIDKIIEEHLEKEPSREKRREYEVWKKGRTIYRDIRRIYRMGNHAVVAWTHA